ncbi:MAG: polyprenol monophosphomannose synthase [Bacteroidetes bacterium]|nr:polyprenol monophosphomannose synthase [Bacteroidota bacterium]
MKNSIVVIPTYNELANIKKLIPILNDLYPELHILVVDDNSPDGTGNYVKELSEKDERVHVLQRNGKMGLGTAYADGFKYMLQKGYEFAFQMDADFSHDPKDLIRMHNAIADYDLIIGSRYVDGVNVVNWPMRRLLLSYFANKYSRIVTGMKVCDGTGGFKCFRRRVLESIDLSKIKSNGYAFQIEMNFKAWKNGWKLKEIPIIFIDRVEGTSKMSKKIVYEAVWMVWKLRLRSIIGKL